MGLHSRISTFLRGRAPKTLNEAINLAISEERIQLMQYRRSQPEHRQHFQKPKPELFSDRRRSFHTAQQLGESTLKTLTKKIILIVLTIHIQTSRDLGLVPHNPYSRYKCSLPNAWLQKRQSENNWTYCDFRRNVAMIYQQKYGKPLTRKSDYGVSLQIRVPAEVRSAGSDDDHSQMDCSQRRCGYCHRLTRKMCGKMQCWLASKVLVLIP
ncbi:unnamed protein product [Leptosia nina]|uniref:Uncharacterized protein n=1 Tax=Leptosia nina TaxID=320188 RepID=A0AAV1IZN2_9NEOP